jgi:6-phosphofructokinase 1
MEGLACKDSKDHKVGPRQLTWSEVYGWNSQGGSNLGSNRSTAEDVGLENVAAGIRRWDLHGLLIIGGFEAYMTAIQLVKGREKHPEFCIPICLIPATISNNVPGTDFSLGADTSVNEITNLCDRIKQSATGTKRRVFVVETMGGYCGYLATMAGIAGGADAAYIFEEKFNIKDLESDVAHIRAKIGDNVQRGLVLRNECANVNYTTDFIEKLYSEESHGVFTCRSNVLGHVQQGGVPSTFDRLYGTKLAARSIDFFEQFLPKPFNPKAHQVMEVSTRVDESAVLIGIVKRAKVFFPINQLKDLTDFKHRMPKADTQWWMKLRSLLRILAKHKSLYTYTSETEGVAATAENR